MLNSPTKCSQNKRNQQNNQQWIHHEVATTWNPSLEDNVAGIASELIVSKNVNKLLSHEWDDLHQYWRGAYIILDQFVILNPWKVPWNWIAFYQNSFISPGLLHHLVDDLEARPLRQILLFLWNNGNNLKHFKN